jgi:hypothetical protein
MSGYGRIALVSSWYDRVLGGMAMGSRVLFR